MEGVCVAYIQEKAGLSQSTISNCMGLLQQPGFVVHERHGQFTFHRRDEDAMRVFLSAVEKELSKPQVAVGQEFTMEEVRSAG